LPSFFLVSRTCSSFAGIPHRVMSLSDNPIVLPSNVGLFLPPPPPLLLLLLSLSLVLVLFDHYCTGPSPFNRSRWAMLESFNSASPGTTLACLLSRLLSCLLFCLPALAPSFLPSFLSACMPSYLSFLPSCWPACLPCP
jgi:hypothetical protein